MLFDPQTVKKLLEGINITGVLHIGAHDCEELPFYTDCLNVPPDKIHWIEAIPFKVEECRKRNIPNVRQAIITDTDNKQVSFNVSNNIQSSSILEFNTHAKEHPSVHYTNSFVSTSTTIDSFFKQNGIDASRINFWNLDIQGCELMALKGGCESIRYADVLYLEVNEQELYKECGMIQELDEFLASHQFQRILTKMTPHGWGDAIYMRSPLVQNQCHEINNR